LVGDTLRDPDDLLAEGVAISETARALAGCSLSRNSRHEEQLGVPAEL
jgi:hypothetical protein